MKVTLDIDENYSTCLMFTLIGVKNGYLRVGNYLTGLKTHSCGGTIIIGADGKSKWLNKESEDDNAKAKKNLVVAVAGLHIQAIVRSAVDFLAKIKKTR